MNPTYLNSVAFRVSTYFFGAGFITGFFAFIAAIAGAPAAPLLGVGLFVGGSILVAFLIMGSMRLFSSPEHATVKTFRKQLNSSDFVELCKDDRSS